MTESDERLVELANTGDSDAFERLYYRYRDWVYRLAWRFTGNHEQSLDVVQETFTYLLRKLPHLKLRARMTTFLYPAVKHLSITAVRKGRRFSSDDETLGELPAPPAPEAGSSRGELAAVLAVLSDEQREVLLMRFVDGLGLDEIAKALNVAGGTVRSRLYRALEILRQDRRTREYFLE